MRAVLALGFQAVVAARNALYDRGWLKSTSASVPVVSVGNVVAGGTGKTPATLLLAEELAPHCRVAIVSRGYAAEAEKRDKPTVVSLGDGPLVPPEVSGDEVWMFASRLPGVIVVAGRDRVAGAEVAACHGAEIVLLDDGMQHRRLARTFEIAAVRGVDPFGGGRFLPWGKLRDQPGRLHNVDLALVQGAPVEELSIPQVGVDVEVTALFEVAGNPYAGDLKGRRVGVFCGIANPTRFVRTVEMCGADVVATHFGRDHRKIESRALGRFASRAGALGAELLLCTEKDAVKGIDEVPSPLPIVWVRSALRICHNRAAWETLKEEMLKQMGKKR